MALFLHYALPIERVFWVVWSVPVLSRYRSTKRLRGNRINFCHLEVARTVSPSRAAAATGSLNCIHLSLGFVAGAGAFIDHSDGCDVLCSWAVASFIG